MEFRVDRGKKPMLVSRPMLYLGVEWMWLTTCSNSTSRALKGNQTMKNTATLAAILASTGFFAAPAHAAEPLQIASIGDISGRVMVHDGSNYTTAKTGMALEMGDRVVTLKGAKANVAFNKGCVASLEENATLAISGVDMCAGAQAEQPVQYAQAIGATATDAAVVGGGTTAGVTAGAVFAGVAVVGTTAAVRNANRTGGDAPVSPQ